MVASCVSPTGDLACDPGVCPDWELNHHPFGSQAGTESTEPHQPGLLPGSLIKTVSLGNFTHGKDGFALRFLVWSERHSFVMRMAGIERRNLIIMKLLTCAKHFKYLIFSISLCCRYQSLITFCRT